MNGPLSTGVVGVGRMGEHHARVYHELPDADLVGIYDADEAKARAIGDRYDVPVRPLDDLLADADAVSIAVPTPFHEELARAAIETETHLLVEKPLVDDPETGRELVRAARDAGVVLQVGHVERFNPAVRALEDVLADHEIIAVDAHRLSPPIDGDRGVSVGVVFDLMIHDLDVVQSLLGASARTVEATGTADGEYVTATVGFEDGVVGTFTASRVTQKKVRRLSITTEECLVTVDYTEQSVRINRQSLPEYVDTDGELRYRRENVVERPTVENGEPLRRELSSFIETIETGDVPVVSGADAVRALELADRIDARVPSVR